MLVIVLIILCIVAVLIFGRIKLSLQFRKEIQQLFSLSKAITGKTFSHTQLAGLPEPVQRYFTYVLKEGQPYISYARIKHDGKFKTGLDKKWINIQGEQYATTARPGFIWKGTTVLFTARDMFIEDKGRLTVSLFSLFKVVDAKGEKYNQGELLRWLGESVLYPSNLLPGERLQWLPIDFNSATLNFNYNELALSFLVTFNAIGEIVQLETKRYMGEENLTTWIIKIAAYKEINHVMVPTIFDVLWRLEKGDFSYAKFNITAIEYNNPEKF